MRKLLQWIKEFKPHIVQFDDGTYGVRERFLSGIVFYDATGYAWEYIWTYIYLSKEQAIKVLKQKLKEEENKVKSCVPVELL